MSPLSRPNTDSNALKEAIEAFAASEAFSIEEQSR